LGRYGEGEFGRQWNPGKALADGTIVGYGNDEDLVHQAYGETHDNWWSAMSMARPDHPGVILCSA
jgi:hypothetical protein